MTIPRNRWWTLFVASGLSLGLVWSAAFAAAPHRLGTFSGFLLLQLLAVTTITDLRERKIPNWATYSTLVLAVALNLVAASATSMVDLSWLGPVGLSNCLIGAVGLFVVMLTIFSITGGGAGDVKLATCLGAIHGWEQGIDAILFGFLVGGACVLAYSIWCHGPFHLLLAIGRSIGSVVLPGVIMRPEGAEQGLLMKKLPLAPFFAAGSLVAVYRDQLFFLAG